MNIREYIRNKYAATPGLENYDLSVGTNIYDLVIRPLGEIFEDALSKDEIHTTTDMRSWASLADLPLDTLRNMSMAKGIEPAAKTDASTNITLHFSSPVDWTIPAGAELGAGDYRYYTRESITITKDVLNNNLDNASRLYIYGNIYVYSPDGHNSGANTIGYIDNAPAELVKITHPAITNGIYDDTAASLVNKIKRRELAITGTNANSLVALVNLYYPGMDAFVVSPGQDLMQRDIVYNVVRGIVSPVLESNFYGKIRRNNVHINSQAYLVSVPEDVISNAYTPDEIDEFTQGQYLSIVEAADSTLYFSTDNVLNETFTQSSERIGNSSPLLATGAVPTRYLYVEDTDYFSSGDAINITDRISLQPTQNGIVDTIETYTASATYNSSGKTLTVSGSTIGDVLVYGCKILITKSSVEYVGYFSSMIGDVITLISAPARLTSGTVTMTVKRVAIYSNISIPYTSFVNMYADVINSEGLYIGPGWIKSEHGMPIGIFFSENEACVIDGELVLGARFSETQVNAIKQVFLRYGVNNISNAMKGFMDIVIIPTNEIAPIATITPNER